MLKTLKFSGEESNFFFVSDLHYNHNRDFIFTKRLNPLNSEIYKDIQDHNNGVIQGWNSVCTNRSIVYHLGDLIFNDPTGDEFLKLVRRLNFQTLYLLWGNHTSGQRQNYLKTLQEQHTNAVVSTAGKDELIYEVYPLIQLVDNNPHKRIVYLPAYAEVSINSTQLVLCHYPIISFNRQSKNAIHLCGHSHGSCLETNKNTGKGKRLDVGIESFSRPISLIEVKKHLANRDLDTRDHHTGEELTP